MPWLLKQWETELDAFLAEVTLPRAHARIVTWLEKLSDEGPHMRRHTKHLGDGLIELKLKIEGFEYRCLYGFHLNCVAIVVCFVKKKQRDQDKIAEARRRLAILTAHRAEMYDVTLN